MDSDTKQSISWAATIGILLSSPLLFSSIFSSRLISLSRSFCHIPLLSYIRSYPYTPGAFTSAAKFTSHQFLLRQPRPPPPLRSPGDFTSLKQSPFHRRLRSSCPYDPVFPLPSLDLRHSPPPHRLSTSSIYCLAEHWFSRSTALRLTPSLASVLPYTSVVPPVVHLL